MKIVMLLPALILSLSTAFATDLSKIRFENLTVEDGLAQGIVECIMQDSQGFIWIATHDGLNRYDGLQFTSFRNNKKDPNSLAANYVDWVVEDREGKIWIGSRGINCYDPFTDQMIRIPVDPGNPDAYHGERIQHITVDADSTLWFSAQGGLIHYLPKTNRFKTYRNNPEDPGSPIFTTVRMTLLTHDNRLLIAPDNDVIYEYDRQNDTFREINYRVAYHGRNSHKFIQEDHQGFLYITSEFSGLHILDPKTGNVRFIDKADGALNNASIRSQVLMVGPDEVWIGTDGGGINVFNPLTGAMQYLEANSKNRGGIANNAVICLFQDRDKNIWVGHFGAGISVWKKNKEKFVSYSHNPLDPASINKEIVSAIFEDSKGRIWIGQDGGGLSQFSEANKSFEHILAQPGVPGSLTSNVILAINEDSDGNLLLGTYAGGLMVFDPESRKVIRSFNSGSGMASDHVWSILRGSGNRYWISDYRQGFFLFDPTEYTIDNHGMNHPELPSCSSNITNITEAPDGKIWFATENNGFCVYDPEKNTTSSFHYDPGNANSLSENDVKSIVFTENYAWIATNGGGLNRFDLKTDSFKVYGQQDGLSSNALMGLLKDNQDNLWISSTRGLMKFDTRTNNVQTFDKSQGIQGSEFKFNSQVMLRDGRMLFGGVNGLTVFHPDSIRNSTVVPSVVFTDFRIFDKSAVPGTKGSPLKKSINYTSHLKLNHKQSVITLDFASLDYNAPLKNQYMYKLEGFDENWINAGNKRSATYTNLDAGRYTFWLKGSNSDGVWNENPRKLVIRVRPPWYRTWLATLLYIAAFIALVVYYIRQREKQAVHDKQVLEQKIREAQDELQQKTKKVEEHEQEIKRRDEDEKDIRFLNEGITRISDIIAKKRRNTEELTHSVISELVRYIGASAGGIFILDDSDETHPVLRASGHFSLSTDKDIHYTFDPGEGNIGTCYTEKRTIIMDNIPDGYIVLSSGLGRISLHHALFVPIIQDNVCEGVIEIASLEELPQNHIGFVEKVAESLASIITIIKSNEKASRMIEQNNAQAEELRAQEEEMRQNLEELMATQEESQRREQDLVSQLSTKTALIEELQQEIKKLKK